MDEHPNPSDVRGQPAAFAPRREVAGPRRIFPLGRETIVEWHTPGRPWSEREFVSFSSLRKRVEQAPALPPVLFIFHCGRCGSTLLGRILEVDAANRVLLEPNALQRFLEVNRAALDYADVRRDLKTLVAAYGLDPRSAEERLVIKFSSLSILHVELFRACFPAAQCLYLLRDPAEVVASELRGLAAFLRPEKRAELAALFGGTVSTLESYTTAEWCAWYVDRNLREARRYADLFVRGIDYVSHRSSYLEVFNAWSATRRTATDPKIAAIFGEYSKASGEAFSAEDDARKVFPGLREVVEPITGEAYRWWLERSAVSGS